MSYRTLATKPLNAGLKSVLKRGGHVGLGLSAFTPVLALANPTGGQVTAGQASIAAAGSNGTIITQKSQSAIINWQQFNIGSNQYVQFLQPSSSSVILNRVIGGSPSSILGSLTANGQVFLVNTNGVFFGKSASIDTQGFLASSLGITDQNFLAHNYVFDQPGASGATVVNQGKISTNNLGYVILAGDYAENDGVISAQSGHVVLASGSKATLSLNGNSFVSFAVNQSTLANYAGVKNVGSILADGGTVIMTADVANALKATVVNNLGLIEAHAITHTGGTIQLLASGGDIENAGTLDASAQQAGQQGGDITLKGDAKTILTNTSNIEATGQGADGGSVEVSGNVIAVSGAMTIGRGGELSLDPGKLEIVTGNGSNIGNFLNTTSTAHVGVSFIEKQLNSGAGVTIEATHLIDASPNVKSIIAAKTGGHALGLEIGNGGQIDLKGVSIDIVGNFLAIINPSTRVAGSSGSAKMSYGQISGGGDVTLDAGAGHVHLAGATMVGSVLHPSIKAGKAITIDATDVSASGSLNLFAGSSIFIDGTAGKNAANTGKVNNTGNVKLTSQNDNHIIKVGDVDAMGGSIVISVGKGSSEGSVTTGKLTAGNNITVSGASDMTAGDIKAGGAISLQVADFLTLKNSLSGAAVISGDKGVAAGGLINYVGTGPLIIRAPEGDLTLTGSKDFGTHSTPQSRSLELTAQGTITLASEIFETGAVSIEAKKLAYVGGNNSDFSIAAGGKIVLDASIGSAATPLFQNVNLSTPKNAIDIERSIYTAGGIGVTEDGNHSGSFAAGIFVGNGDGTAITLSGRGVVVLTGARVAIGYTGTSAGTRHALVGGATAPITVTTLGFLGIHGTGSEATVDIRAGHASLGTGVMDRSVLMKAGTDMDVSGREIYMSAGAAAARLTTGKTVTATANLTLKAGGNLTISGSGSFNQVTLGGGHATASAGGVPGRSETATATANLSITAGGELEIDAQQVHVSDGYGWVEAQAGNKAVATASASAGVTLSAKGDLTLAGGHSTSVTGVYIDAAGHVVGGGRSLVNATGGKAAATFHGDISITSGNLLTVSGNQVQISAGNQVGMLSSAMTGTQVQATGSKASAKLIVTANTTLSAGIGGLSLMGTGSAEAGVTVKGGHATGKAVSVFAGGASGASDLASFQGQAVVNLDTVMNGNGITLRGVKATSLVAGSSAGKQVALTVMAKGAQAHLTADAGIKLSGLSILVSAGQAAGDSVSIHGGDRVAMGASINARSTSAAATLVADATVTLTAGSSAGIHTRKVTIRGGNDLAAIMPSSGTVMARHTKVWVKGVGDRATLTADAGVAVAAKTLLTIEGDSGLNIDGGSEVGHGASADVINTAPGASAKITLDAGLTFTGKVAHMTADTGAVHLKGGDDAAAEAGAGADAPAGAATLTAQAGISVIAGTVEISDGSPNFAMSIAAGDHAGASAGVGVFGAGKAQLNVGAGVAIDATSHNLTVTALGSLTLRGGDDAGTLATAAALSANGKVSMDLQSALSLTAAGALVIKGDGVTLRGGDGALTARTDSVQPSPNAHATEVLRDSVEATGDRANVALLADVGLSLAGGKQGVSISAAGVLDIRGGDSAADAIQVNAGLPRAKVNMDAEAAVSIVSKGALTLHGAQVTVRGGNALLEALSDGSSNASGAHPDHVKATFYGGGDASMSLTANASVKLSATGEVKVTAGGALEVLGGDGGATSMQVSSGPEGSKGAKTVSLQSGVGLTAGGDILLTGASVELWGGDLGFDRAHINAHAGALTVGKSAAVAINAGSSASIVATAPQGISIRGGASVGDSVEFDAAHASKAGFTDAAGVAISVKGGLLVLSAPGIGISAGVKAAVHSTVDVGQGGSAAFTVQNGVAISDAGVLTVDTGSDGYDIRGGNPAANATIKASGSGAVAAFSAQSAVTMSAKAVNFIGNSGILIQGGNGGHSLGLTADSGGAVTAKLASQVSITASGVLTVSAATGSMNAGTAVQDAALTASHGKIALTDTSGTALTAVGNLSMNLNSGSLALTAGVGGSGQHISAGPAAGISEKTDMTVLLKSAAKLALSNIVGMPVVFASFASLPDVSTTGSGKVSGLLNGSISILGKSVTSTNLTGFTSGGGLGASANGIVTKTGLTVTGGLGKLGFGPIMLQSQGLLMSQVSGLGTLQQDAQIMSLEPVLSAPELTPTPTLFSPDEGSLSIGSAACQASLLRDDSHCRPRR